MNTISSLSRPGIDLASAFNQPAPQVGASQPDRLADGLDLNVGRPDILDQLVFSKTGGGRISCPEGTKPEITTEGNDVVVTCKPSKKKEPTTLPNGPSDTPILP